MGRNKKEARMNKKTKFKPRITKVVLNPEQAVLLCDCYINGVKMGGSAGVDGSCSQSVCTGFGANKGFNTTWGGFCAWQGQGISS